MKGCASHVTETERERRARVLEHAARSRSLLEHAPKREHNALFSEQFFGQPPCQRPKTTQKGQKLDFRFDQNDRYHQIPRQILGLTVEL